MEKIINNKNIGYYKFGNGLKNMVIVPGLGQRSVIPMGKAVQSAYKLFNEDFTVYLIDRACNLKKDDYIDEIADDYIGMFEELKLNDIYLFGVSFGGMISQRIVEKRADLVKKLTLISTNSGRNNNCKDNIRKWYDLASDKKFKELNEDVANKIYTEPIAKMILSNVNEDDLVLSEEELNNFLIQARAVINFEGFNDLEKIDVPTFIMAAKGDKLFSYEEAIFLNENIKNSKLYLFNETCSHAIFDEVLEVKQLTYDFFME